MGPWNYKLDGFVGFYWLIYRLWWQVWDSLLLLFASLFCYLTWVSLFLLLFIWTDQSGRVSGWIGLWRLGTFHMLIWDIGSFSEYREWRRKNVCWGLIIEDFTIGGVSHLFLQVLRSWCCSIPNSWAISNAEFESFLYFLPSFNVICIDVLQKWIDSLVSWSLNDVFWGSEFNLDMFLRNSG